MRVVHTFPLADSFGLKSITLPVVFWVLCEMGFTCVSACLGDHSGDEHLLPVQS